MPTFVEPRKRGRPARDPIDGLRTRLWFRAVKLASKLESAYAIELRLEPELVKRKVGGVARPRKWDHYEAGTRAPRRIAGKRYAVDLCEEHFPCTSWYFESPLWSVLRKDEVDQRWVERQLRAMSGAVTNILLEPSPRAEGSDRRFKAFDSEAASALANLKSFEALTAILLLVTKSELIASPELRDLALESYRQIQPAMLTHSVVGPFAAELFRAIDVTCKHWVFPSPDSRLDIVIFSDALLGTTSEPSADAEDLKR